MLTPSPRGFPAQSFTATVCDRFEDSKKGKTTATVPIDLDTLFPTVPRMAKAAPPRIIDRTPTATVSMGYEERKLFIPTGRRKTKKDGQPGAEEKIPVLLVICTATVSDGKRDFTFTASNRATKIKDSRDNQRKPIEDVRRELARLCPPAVAEMAGNALAEYLQSPRDRKPRIKPETTPALPRPPKLELAVKRVPFSARKHLLDSVWTSQADRETAVERFDRELREREANRGIPAPVLVAA